MLWPEIRTPASESKFFIYLWRQQRSLDNLICFIALQVQNSGNFRNWRWNENQKEPQYSAVLDGSADDFLCVNKKMQSYINKLVWGKMLYPIFGLSPIWWLILYATLLLMLSPFVLVIGIFLPNFPLLLLRRMCYIPIESI